MQSSFLKGTLVKIKSVRTGRVERGNHITALSKCLVSERQFLSCEGLFECYKQITGW